MRKCLENDKQYSYFLITYNSTNTSVEGSPYKADSVDIPAVSIPSDVTSNSILTQIILSQASPQPAAPIDPSIDKWFFISGHNL